MRIQVKDFMSKPVTTCEPGNSVSYVRDLMKKNSLHAIPVVEYEKKLPNLGTSIKGIVTSSDLENAINGEDLVTEVMTPRLHIIHETSSAKAAAKMMLKHNVRHLVAMEDGEITGIISSLDFVKLVANHSESGSA